MILCIKENAIIMEIKEVLAKDKESLNKLALHPLQGWEWGEFRKKTGIEVVRLGKYADDKLSETAQLTIHEIPFTSWTIGYLPKSQIPSQEMLKKLIEVGKQYNCIFIKLEPNISASNNSKFLILNSKFPIVSSLHPLFTKYTFQLDLTPSEDELLKNMHPKTRYNIKIAQKHKVSISEDNSDTAFNIYLHLLQETTKRQKFYAHDEKYHRLMWQTLKPIHIAHLFLAKYNNQVLVAWILFLFNNVLYYPYGASSNVFKNVMASNLIMWEAIRFGKKKGARLFDMWGSLGPDPDPKDPWYGFHRFKEGYGPTLVEFVGSYDLVVNPILYYLYNFTYITREVFLKIKSYF